MHIKRKEFNMKKKRILFVCDEKGWVFERHALECQKRLTEYEIHIVFRKMNIPLIENNYDCIYVMDPMPLKHGYPNNEKCILGLRCQFLYEEHPNGAKGLYYEGLQGRCVSIHDKCSLFHVVNKSQYKTFSGFVPKPLMLVQHGVDENIFFDDGNNFKHKEFCVGVSGRASRIKGFDLVQQACQKQGYKFMTASYGMNKLIKEQMPNFYRQLDAFVCMSSSEGINNPTIESGACGIPVISTRTGAAEEIIKNGENGFLIERNVESLISVLEKIKNDSSLKERIGKSIAVDIKSGWTWATKINDFRKMFEKFFNIVEA
jgi:glycosyltransferase involved in cell wall biosynthesis